MNRKIVDYIVVFQSLDDLNFEEKINNKIKNLSQLNYHLCGGLCATQYVKCIAAPPAIFQAMVKYEEYSK